MTLPRVLVDVVSVGTAGWQVRVEGAGVESTYVMPAEEVVVGGESQRVPVGAADAQALLSRIRTRATECGDVRRYGEWLFGALLEPVWAELRAAQAVQHHRGVELALRWPVAETDLHRLVWEAMHHETTPLAGDPTLLIAITRLVPAEVDDVCTIDRTPRVLFAMGGSPVEDTIRPGAMFMGLLRAFDAEGMCSSKAVQASGLDGLAEDCAAFLPDLVHVVAHGGFVDGRGTIALGRDKHVTAEMLAPALTGAHRPLAVVLSACGSGSFSTTDGAPLAAELVERGIPIVSAVSGEVSEQACRLYTRRLVAAIGEGSPPAIAAARGRRAALQQSSDYADQLDWAMPSLFIAESVPASFRPVDPDSAKGVVDLATRLKLRDSPLFIGRTTILDKIDRLVSNQDTDRIGVLGAVGDDIAGMGGTRLLRELGYLLLLRGHLPLMLGPFALTAPPKDLKGLIEQLLKNIGFLASAADLLLPQFKLLDEYYDSAASTESKYDALLAFHQASARFAADGTELDWAIVQTKLTVDFAALADAAHGFGRPFGSHTKVVLLGDEMQKWGVAAELVKHLETYGQRGLGEASLAFTASIGAADGLSLKAFRDRMANTRGFRFPLLGPLSNEEAVLGFQWVLLHPAQLQAEPLQPVYAARPEARNEKLAMAFRFLKGKPTAVRDPDFYWVAELLADHRDFATGDDEAAWASYLELYP
jgi:hypothetical protein